MRPFLEAHDTEITRLETTFSSYSLSTVGKNEIRIWLRQFNQDVEIGLNLLRHVDFYTPRRITGAFQAAHEQLLTILQDRSLERVFFFPFGHAGKSGSALSYNYKTANDIPVGKFKNNFTELATLFGDEAEQHFKLVFIDDFIGTGNQAIDTWERIREIPFPRDSEVFLVTLAGFDTAIRNVSERTELRVITPRLLTDEDRIFSTANEAFSEDEKRIIRAKCENVPPYPQGYENTQSLIVFYYRTPDNTISILRCRNEHWIPLFPRHVC